MDTHALQQYYVKNEQHDLHTVILFNWPFSGVRLGQSPEVNSWEFDSVDFLRLDAFMKYKTQPEINQL